MPRKRPLCPWRGARGRRREPGGTPPPCNGSTGTKSVTSVRTLRRAFPAAACPRTEGMRYALDNGAWSAHHSGVPWDADAFLRMVTALGAGADFLVVPDIVADGTASLRRSRSWVPFLLGSTRQLLLARARRHDAGGGRPPPRGQYRALCRWLDGMEARDARDLGRAGRRAPVLPPRGPRQHATPHRPLSRRRGPVLRRYIRLPLRRDVGRARAGPPPRRAPPLCLSPSCSIRAAWIRRSPSASRAGATGPERSSRLGSATGNGILTSSTMPAPSPLGRACRMSAPWSTRPRGSSSRCARARPQATAPATRCKPEAFPMPFCPGAMSAF